ncbi:MAG: TonB-dependent receptor plug domain-containing protein [Bacteroidota bacterium]
MTLRLLLSSLIALSLLFSCKTTQSVASADPNEEVVDLGYIKEKKKNSNSTGKSIGSQQGFISLKQYFQRVPGIRMMGNEVMIVGMQTSFTSDTRPLFIIDGVRVGRGYDAVSTAVNPNDIAKVTVLKDPSDLSLYGVAGSNGVIIIRTKDN